MSKSPAYQWYPKDILSSARVAELDLKEECAYRRALDYCWLNGSLPSDPAKLARIIGKGCTAKIASAIIPFFDPLPNDSDKIFHERLERERKKQSEYSTKQSLNGKLGGRPKRTDNEQNEESEVKGLGFSGESQTEANIEAKKSFAYCILHTAVENTEREARARKDFSEAGESVNQGTPPPMPERPKHAPGYEQVLEYFQRQGVPELTEAFMLENDKTDWTYRAGGPIVNWPAWAMGFIRKARSAADKEAHRAEKQAKNRPRQSTYEPTRADFYSEEQWQYHLKKLEEEQRKAEV